MSCCGNRRAALGRALSQRSAWGVPPAPPPASAPAPVRLAYVGPVPVMLPSPTGGPALWLEHAGQIVEADPQQAAALLRTGWFRSPAHEGPQA